MTDPVIALDPAALRELGSQLGSVAGGIPYDRLDGGPVADPAADAAFQDFAGAWTSYLRDLSQAVERSAQQARLTALAFELLDRS